MVVAVAVGVKVGVAVGEEVGVGVAVAVGVGMAVAVGVDVVVALGVGVGVSSSDDCIHTPAADTCSHMMSLAQTSRRVFRVSGASGSKVVHNWFCALNFPATLRMPCSIRF